MDENRTEVMESTDVMGTEDGTEKRFDVEGILGTVAIGAAAIGAFEAGKFAVKKLKEPVKKGFGAVKSKFAKNKDKPVDTESSEPDHEELTTEVKDKAKGKKSEKSKE